MIAITRDQVGIADRLARSLKARGVDAIVVDHIPENCSALIYLGGLNIQQSDALSIEVNRNAFLAAKHIAPFLAEKGGIFVTVQDTGGLFGLSECNQHAMWGAGLSGLAKTAAMEWPKAYIKTIDIECAGQKPEKIAERLCDEILNHDPDVEVGLPANGKRMTIRLTESALNSTTLAVSNDDVLIVIGGARGVTATCLLELAKQVQPKIALFGRTTLTNLSQELSVLSANEIKSYLIKKAQAENKKVTPKEIDQEMSSIIANQEIRTTVNQLTALGCDVTYMNIDITNTEQVNSAVNQVRQRFGKITGFIQAAGVLADKFIADKTQEQFNQVFNTKILGLQNILNATQKDKLKLIVMFSSVAARLGNQGQCDYAMANEILNKVANQERLRRGKKCLVKSINWGPWDGGMVNLALKKMFEQNGIVLLPKEVGARMFVQELSFADAGQVEVVIGGLIPNPKLINQIPDKDTQFKISVNAKTHSYLQSHVIKATPVVPAVLGMEWMMRAAQAFYPGKEAVACHHLEIPEGIRFFKFTQENEWITVRKEAVLSVNPLMVQLSIYTKDGRKRYQANIELNDQLPKKKADKAMLNALAHDSWPWNNKQIYNQDMLFHGQDFQVIKTLNGVGDASGYGYCIGISELKWPKDEWQVDIAALDGAMQFSLLWGYRRFKLRTIPTGIKTFRRYHQGPIKGNILCAFTAKACGNLGLVSDIVMVDEANNVLAELEGVQMWPVLNETKHEVLV